MTADQPSSREYQPMGPGLMQLDKIYKVESRIFMGFILPIHWTPRIWECRLPLEAWRLKSEKSASAVGASHHSGPSRCRCTFATTTHFTFRRRRSAWQAAENGRNRTFWRNYLQSGRFVNDFEFPNSWCYVIALSASLSRSHWAAISHSRPFCETHIVKTSNSRKIPQTCVSVHFSFNIAAENTVVVHEATTVARKLSFRRSCEMNPTLCNSVATKHSNTSGCYQESDW